MSFELTSPFASFEMQRTPNHWKAILVTWIVFWLAASVVGVWFYAFVLPEWVGFETTVLLGIAAIVLFSGEG